MIWLLLITVVLHTGFYWIFNPVIALSTQLFEMHALDFVLLSIFIWIFSGRQSLEDINNS